MRRLAYMRQGWLNNEGPKGLALCRHKRLRLVLRRKKTNLIGQEEKLMAIKEKKAMPRKRLSAAAWIASMVLGFSLPSLAQQPVRGTITGTVSSDQGRVIGF